jgi:glutamate synthase (NADPH) small chain
MGKVTGFMEYQRELPQRRPVAERVNDWFEIYQDFASEKVQQQGARCMDCGVPFCHTGCPLTNIIPDWNDLVYKGRWREALRVLHATNNFPEFTGRVCPAPCEAACVLGINEPPVAIKLIEHSIIDYGYEHGWITPEIPEVRTGKKVAVIGSGPAGLAAAQQLARAGHWVTVFEKADRIGGLLRYGIPDFKMEKWLIDRRIEQMREEGVTFRTGVYVGNTDSLPAGVTSLASTSVSARKLMDEFDAVVVSGGAEHPRDLPIPGRDLAGIHYAMEFLPLQNRRVAGDGDVAELFATGKHVIVIGGGDTGSDCVGTSNRHGARSVTQFELLAQPPDVKNNPVWPYWPAKLRTSSSHEEGAKRDWSVSTKMFKGQDGRVTGLVAARVEWGKDPATGQLRMHEVPGSEFELPADLVLLAMGFVSPVHQGLLDELGVAYDQRGNVRATTDGAGCYQTSLPKIFAAGDMRRGQSLVVWAIREGRQCARAVDEFLMGSSELPR